MDQNESQLDNLAELSDIEIEELQASIVSEFETVEQAEPSLQTVEAMTQLADNLDAVRGEVARRVAQAEELSARAAEASARVKGDTAAVAEPADEEEDTDSKDADKADEEEDGKPFATETADEETFSADSTETVEAPEATEAAATEEVAAVEVPEVAEAAVEEEPVEVPTTEEAAPEASTDEETEEAPVDTDSATEAPAEVEETEAEAPAEASTISDETTIAPEAQEEAPVTAAANEASIEVPADRQFSKATEAPVAITAGADVPGFTAGSTLTDMKDVAVAMTRRLDTLRRVSSGGDGEQYTVATIATELPADRFLNGDAEGNWNKIQDVAGPEAIMASGGWATPVETRYDVFGLGTDIRPVRDSLPRFQADRGGISVITPPVLADYANAVGVWTAANDAAASPNPAVKPTLTVTGGTFTTYQTDAITLQLKIGNMFARAYPELLERHIELARIQHARVAELNILSKIDAGSTQVTAASVLGFARDFIVQIKKAGAAYRSRHRIDPHTNLRAIIPSWVMDAVSADLSMQMPGDDALGQADAQIKAYLQSGYITITTSPDMALFGAQGAGALLNFPSSFEWYLFAEGTWLFLDSGSLDLGVVRDSGLVGTNDYKMFLETFEGVAKIGTESLAITSTISVNGQAAALKVTT